MINLNQGEEPAEYNTNYILFWNHVGLELNRLTHSVGGPQRGPAVSARSLGILHLAIHDAYFAFSESTATYLTKNSSDPIYGLPKVPNPADPTMPAADRSRLAVAGSAITVLQDMYTQSDIRVSPEASSYGAIDQLSQALQQMIGAYPNLDVLSPDYQYGIAVGKAILRLLDIKPQDPEINQDSYRPKPGRYYFRDDPTHPVRLLPTNPNDPNGPRRAVHIYNVPFYGQTAKRFAVQMTADGTPNGPSTEHLIADPPVNFGTNDLPEYNDALADVIRMGGSPSLNSTLRTPSQTTNAYFWAYDGSNLIGTPPRFYNQILRKIAWTRKPAGAPTNDAINADFARLFAFVNVALADAGVFCWREKYRFEFWRPLSGVREDPNPTLADPFWLSLGAPDTNSNRASFKPPFPAYPSGHATLGAAAFQTMRLYYRQRDNLSFAPDEPDDIGFSIVSDELNGVNRDLDDRFDASQPITNQPGDVRTRVERSFGSLWEAIFDNAISRVWLGVHWRFDAFAAKDVLEPNKTAAAAPLLLSSSSKEEGVEKTESWSKEDGVQKKTETETSLYALNPNGTTSYLPTSLIRYKTLAPRVDRPGQLFPVGGVPLGMGIAEDVFGGGLKPTPAGLQPVGFGGRGRGI
ncbi:MAG: hypothetical protein M1812_007727 [Candelaria pacifica]|nr:MAG: hypothetical protein M1812_007727 [Candelaria pacifica]